MSQVFVHYDPDFPVPAVAHFAPVLRGQLPADLNLSINAGQAIQLWICGQTFPVGDDVVETASLEPQEASEAAIADWLEAKASGAPMAQGWEQLVGIALPYILEGIKRLAEERRKRRAA